MNDLRGWLRRRQLTLILSLFIIGWYLFQLVVFSVFGKEVAQWWFYFEKPPNAVSPGIVLGPISHDMSSLTHLSINIFFLLIAGSFAEPYLDEKKLLYVVLGFGYLGTYLANATAWLHQLWMIAGASGGILALWAYAGLKLRHKAYEYRSGLDFSRDSIEQLAAVLLILAIPVFLLQEAVLAAQFHSGHVIGLLLGCAYFGYEYQFKTPWTHSL